MKLPSFRTLSFLAYVLSGTGLFAVATFGYSVRMPDGTADTGLLSVWIVFGFVGSLLIVAKNQLLQDRALRIRIYLSDLIYLAILLMLVAVLPRDIGLLKGLALLPVFGVYYWWYQKRLAEQLSA